MLDTGKRVRYYCGIEKDKDGDRLSTMQVLDAQAYMAHVFSGLTRFDAFGEWTNEDGERISERSEIFEVITSLPDERLSEVAHTLATTLNQSCVLMTIEEVKFDCVS